MDIKRVSSHVVVEENEKENLPLRTSDTMVNLEKKVVTALIVAIAGQTGALMIVTHYKNCP